MLERVWRRRNPSALLVGMLIGTATVRIVWSFLKELKIEFPYDSAVPHLVIYMKKPKTLFQKDTCTPMFIAVLFTIARM